MGGLLLSTLLIGWFGFDRVIDAVGNVGWVEFAVIVGCRLVLFIPLGLAWDAIARSRERHARLYSCGDAWCATSPAISCHSPRSGGS